jgi:hypothetical protein
MHPQLTGQRTQWLAGILSVSSFCPNFGIFRPIKSDFKKLNKNLGRCCVIAVAMPGQS